MKKTLTINLNNVVFHIDEDAYEILQNYLKDVETRLSIDERQEVMADVESRIAEIFSESLKRNKTVINIADVEKIIEVLGKPNQYGEDTNENDTKDQKTNQQSEAQTTNRSKYRRYYRDGDNAILGGVAAGLASYFNWDVVWIRIILAILVLVGAGTLIPIYLVVWIIAPRATTTAQRLEMQGEDVTIDNIKSEINNVKNYVESDKFKQQANGFGEKLIEILRTIIKIFVGFIGAILGFAGILVTIVLIFALISLFFIPGILAGFSPEIAADWAMFTGNNAAIFIIGTLIVIGSPLFLLFYWANNLLKKRRYENATTVSIVTLLIWLAGIFMLYSAGANSIQKFTGGEQVFHINWNETNEPSIDTTRTIGAFNAIEASGNIQVELMQDSSTTMHINAPESIIEKIKTEVINGTLKIYTDKFLVNYPIKIRVSTDSLFSIDASGAARIHSGELFNTSRFQARLSGAAQSDFDVNVTGSSEIEVSGASQMDISGKTTSVAIEASGGSKVNAEFFTAENAQVRTSAAAKAIVFASNNFEGKASGASDIDCYGKPKQVNKHENMGATIRIK